MGPTIHPVTARGLAIRTMFALAVCVAASAVTQAQGRRLAPGVLKTIAPNPEEAETYSGPREVVELARVAERWQPNFYPPSDTLAELAKNATFRRTIWQLEFSFKPVRTVRMNLPGPDGRLQSRLVWYLLFRVRNKGGHLQPVSEQDETGNTIFNIEKVNFTTRCFPVFVLEGHEYGTRYTDRVIPAAVARIHEIEIRDPQVRLYNTVEITSRSIKVSTGEIDHGMWGVATWDDVDARTDYFSVFVQGLTNAYQWEDPEDGGRNYLFKTLQLNFWRPGDTVRQEVDRIRYGMPLVKDAAEKQRLLELYRVDRPSEFNWVYRP